MSRADDYEAERYEQAEQEHQRRRHGFTPDEWERRKEADWWASYGKPWKEEER